MAEGGKTSFFGMVPLVIIAVLVYVGAYLWAGTVDTGSEAFRAYQLGIEGSVAGEVSDAALKVGFVLNKHMSVQLVSGDVWRFDVGTAILMLGLLFLFWEVTRATDSSSTSLTNHAISMMVFIGCFLLFLLVPGFGTSVFFLLTIMALFDVVGGFIITAVSARRDFGGGGIPLTGP